MSRLPLLTETQMPRIEPLFSISRGLRRVDDRRVISGIVHVIRHSLQWRNAPRDQPAKPQPVWVHLPLRDYGIESSSPGLPLVIAGRGG